MERFAPIGRKYELWLLPSQAVQRMVLQHHALQRLRHQKGGSGARPMGLCRHPTASCLGLGALFSLLGLLAGGAACATRVKASGPGDCCRLRGFAAPWLLLGQSTMSWHSASLRYHERCVGCYSDYCRCRRGASRGHHCCCHRERHRGCCSKHDHCVLGSSVAARWGSVIPQATRAWSSLLLPP